MCTPGLNLAMERIRLERTRFGPSEYAFFMAPSLAGKGYLKLSLVSCAVAMAPVRSDREKIRFNNLNRETGNRLKLQYLDSETGDVVTGTTS